MKSEMLNGMQPLLLAAMMAAAEVAADRDVRGIT
jgi:hypothetical protein